MSDICSGSERDLEARVRELEGNFANLRSSIDHDRLQSIETRAAVYDFIWKSLAGVDFAKAKIRRFIPVRIYIDDERDEWQLRFQRNDLLQAIFTFLASGEFYYDFELPKQKGSWQKFFGAISSWWGTEDDGKRRLTELEGAAKAIILDNPTAEVAKIRAAAAVLIDKAKDFAGATISFGNMLLVVETEPDGKKHIAVGSMSESSLRAYEENLLEQIKPANAVQLLDAGGDMATAEVEKIKLPRPDSE